MKDYDPLLAGISYTAGNMLIKGIPFFTLPVFTRLMPAADFGLYNTYLAYEMIGSILLGFGLAGTIRVAAAEYPDRFEDYISAVYGIQMLIAAGAFLLLAIFLNLHQLHGWMTPEVAVILLSNCLCTQIFNTASAKYAISGDVKRNLFLSFLMTGMNVCFSLLFCIYMCSETAYMGRIYGTFLSALATAVLAFVWQKSKSTCWHDSQMWRFGLRMGSPLILHSLSLTFLSQCDKIMIRFMEGNEEAGIYSLAVTLSSVLSVLVTSADNAWAPWFFERLARQEHQEIRRKNSYLVLAFAMLSGVAVLVSPEVIRMMSPREYWDSTRCFPILLAAVFYNFIYIIPVNFEYYYKKTTYIASTTVAAAVLNLILNAALITAAGYTGAAYATCLSKVLLFVLHWRKAWKIEKIRLADTNYVVISAAAVTLLSVFVSAAEQNFMLRYIVLAVLLSVFVAGMRHYGVVHIIKKKVERK